MIRNYGQTTIPLPSAAVSCFAVPELSTHQYLLVSDESGDETANAVSELLQTRFPEPLLDSAFTMALAIVASEKTSVEQLVPALLSAA